MKKDIVKLGYMNSVKLPALCVDLDGTIRGTKSGKTFPDGPEDILLFGDVEERIWEYRDGGYLIFAISNQGGVAYGIRTPEQIDEELDATLAQLNRNPFHCIQTCYHHPGGSVPPYNTVSLFRKPQIGMLAACEVQAFNDGYIVDWERSLFVGDRPEDEECAKNAGIRFINADTFFGRKCVE